MKKVLSIIGDHHALGPRDLCGLPNRLFMELTERDPSVCWSVLGHGALGGIKSVLEVVPNAFVEMFSYEADSYTAFIWVGVGEAKSGGIPLDAWTGMLDHLICMARAADVTPILIAPLAPPFQLVEKPMRRWLKKASVAAHDLAQKRNVSVVEISLDPRSFIDLYALSARAYQHISSVLADEYLGARTARRPKLAKAPEVIYKRKKSVPPIVKPKSQDNDDGSVVIMQPDKIRTRRSAHG